MSVPPVIQGEAVGTLGGLFFGATVLWEVNGRIENAQTALAAYGETESFLFPLVSNTDTLRIGQEFCRGDGAMPINVPILTCSDLPSPQMQPPQVGDEQIELDAHLPGANIRVYADGAEIGDGSGPFVHLIRPLALGERVAVTQTVGTCTSRFAHELDVACRAVRRVRNLGTHEAFGVGAGSYTYTVAPGSFDGASSDVRAEVRYPVDPIDRASIVPYGPPRPVVFFMHGNLPNYVFSSSRCARPAFCTPAIPPGAIELGDPHLGFVSEMDALARDGFIAISIDASDFNCRGGEFIEAGRRLWQEHIDEWDRLNLGISAHDTFGSSMTGRVDLSRTILVGHSRGALRIPLLIDGNTNPGVSFVAAVLLAPPVLPIVPARVVGVPMLLLRGSRDTEPVSFPYFDIAIGERSQMYIEGGTHTGFLDTHANYCESRADNPTASGPYLDPRQQTAMLREWTRRWARRHAYGVGPDERGVVTGDGEVRSLDNGAVSISYSEKADFVLDDFQDRTAETSFFSPVEIAGFQLWEETLLGGALAPVSTMTHSTSGLFVSALEGGPPGGTIRHTTFPRIDPSGFRFLSLRVGRVFSHVGSDLALLVAMNGGRGDTVNTDLVTPIRRQPIQTPADYSAMTTTLRIPLVCLESVNPEAAGALTSTYIEDASGDGAFMIDDLALQR